MNNLFLLFPPLLHNAIAKPRVCTSIAALHAEPIKILASYTARLKEIRTIKLAPCHQFWLYTPFHNEEALEDVNLLEIQEWERK